MRTINTHMARITPPAGWNWNRYIQNQADLAPDQSLSSRRLVKRDIKLGEIAQLERQAGGNTASASYRIYNQYVSPGVPPPAPGHPWLPEE